MNFIKKLFLDIYRSAVSPAFLMNMVFAAGRGLGLMYITLFSLVLAIVTGIFSYIQIQSYVASQKDYVVSQIPGFYIDSASHLYFTDKNNSSAASSASKNSNTTAGTQAQAIARDESNAESYNNDFSASTSQGTVASVSSRVITGTDGIKYQTDAQGRRYVLVRDKSGSPFMLINPENAAVDEEALALMRPDGRTLMFVTLFEDKIAINNGYAISNMSYAEMGLASRTFTSESIGRAAMTAVRVFGLPFVFLVLFLSFLLKALNCMFLAGFVGVVLLRLMAVRVPFRAICRLAAFALTGPFIMGALAGVIFGAARLDSYNTLGIWTLTGLTLVYMVLAVNQLRKNLDGIVRRRIQGRPNSAGRCEVVIGPDGKVLDGEELKAFLKKRKQEQEGGKASADQDSNPQSNSEATVDAESASRNHVASETSETMEDNKAGGGADLEAQQNAGASEGSAPQSKVDDAQAQANANNAQYGQEENQTGLNAGGNRLCSNNVFAVESETDKRYCDGANSFFWP